MKRRIKMPPDWLENILVFLCLFSSAIVLIYITFFVIPAENRKQKEKDKRRLEMKISVNEDEILVVFKKGCSLEKAIEILSRDCYTKDNHLWESHNILVCAIHPYYRKFNKKEGVLKDLNSNYREFIEVAIYNYEDNRYIK